MKNESADRWAAWQKERYLSLFSDGMPSGIAFLIAQAEARTRQNISRIIGHIAAEKAQLLITSDGDQLRFLLIGSSDLSDDQQDRLHGELGVQLGITI